MDFYNRFTEANYFQAPVNAAMVGKFRFWISTTESKATLWCTDTHTGASGRIVFRFVASEMLASVNVLGLNISSVVIDLGIKASATQHAHTRRYTVPLDDFRPINTPAREHANITEYELHVEALENYIRERNTQLSELTMKIRHARQDVAKTTVMLESALESTKRDSKVIHF